MCTQGSYLKQTLTFCHDTTLIAAILEDSICCQKGETAKLDDNPQSYSCDELVMAFLWEYNPSIECVHQFQQCCKGDSIPEYSPPGNDPCTYLLCYIIIYMILLWVLFLHANYSVLSKYQILQIQFRQKLSSFYDIEVRVCDIHLASAASSGNHDKIVLCEIHHHLLNYCNIRHISVLLCVLRIVLFTDCVFIMDGEGSNGCVEDISDTRSESASLNGMVEKSGRKTTSKKNTEITALCKLH